MKECSTSILLSIVLAIFPFIAFTQEVVSYDSQEWHRKENREEIARIYYGEVDQAIENMKTRLASQTEKDPELMFGLSLAWSVKKDQRKAFDYFQEAIDYGLPASRFMTHMPGFETLHQYRGFRRVIEPYNNKPVHGPMLGGLTDSECNIWFRTWQEAQVVVYVYSDPEATQPVSTSSNTTKASDDYTTVVPITGLKPNTGYYYKVSINQIDAGRVWSFRTLDQEGLPGEFAVAFGGCSAYNPEFERIWDTIGTHPIKAFLTLGDNVYANHHTLPQVNRFCYYQRQSRPEFERLTARVPYIGIWDDHDFGENDSYGGPEIHEPAWKVKILKVFKENFANPYYATGGVPGIWFDYKMGDVQFFMLDGRYYRQPSDDGTTSMLGPVQLQWLKDELSKSTAIFKVIVSPVNWSDDSKEPMEGRIDTWEGYKKEREEIFSFLTENSISGVFLLSADRHRHDAWKHYRVGDYPLYEFTSSRLTNIHYHALMPASLFGYNEKNGFAILTFNTLVNQPHVVYDVYSIDNELIHRVRVYLHQMGVSER
jgi:alkaline phosphatase D